MLDEVTFTYGESELAFRVIEQAWKDAHLPNDTYNRQKARCFLCAYPPSWRGSLFFWCALCGMNSEYLVRVAREKWKPQLLKRENNVGTNGFV